MRILLSWLREYVEAPEPARELARALTMAGLAVESVVEEHGETVLEMDITANRCDALSHLGVAREVAAIYGRGLRRPEIRLREEGPPASSATSIEIDAADLCPRYTGRVALDAAVRPAPDWMRRRIELCGVRSINNVADATNYVLLECGHPTHAFDLDTLKGARILVRRPRPGERLTTLDGVERGLEPDQLVIADGERAVALAGVMGGADTEISARTRNVLIESAWFEPASIRRTARRLGLHTEASHRFERGTDIEAAPWAADRVAGFLAELAGARVLPGRIDCYPADRARQPIPLRAASMGRHLGVEISAAEVERILRALGFSLEQAASGWLVTPPSARLDVEREIDLIEEIARLWGYDRFPTSLPEWAGEAEPAENAGQRRRLREVARSLGYDEAVTLAFIPAAEAERFGEWKPAALRNPVSEAHAVMRNSAIPGLLRALEWNLNRGAGDLRLFEIGRLYRPDGGGQFQEPPVLALAATGRTRGAGWSGPAAVYDFFEMKADVVRLLELFSWSAIRIDREEKTGYYRQGRSARASVDGQEAARFGELREDLAAERKFRHPVLLAELWLDRLYGLAPREPRYRPLPRVPAVDRDLSLLLPEGTEFQQIVEAVGQQEHLVRLEPVEIFRGGPIPPGRMSLLLRAVWQRPEASLTDEQVNGYARHIVGILERRFGAEQR